MNIGIIVSKLRDGGAERAASNLSLFLSDKYNVYLILYDGSNIIYPYRGEIINLDIKSTVNPFKKFHIFYNRVKAVRKIKKKYNLQATISLMEGPGIVNIFSGGNKVIVSVRNYLSLSLLTLYEKFYRILLSLFYNKADYIAAVSRIVKKDLIENFGLNKSKTKVIYNACDVEMIKERSEEELAPEYSKLFEGPVIINVGKLELQKGHWYLIRAFKKVKKKIKDARLFIIGKGSLEKKLKKLVRELDLEEDVIFTGFAENPFKYLARADVFVLSSYFEGFPNVIAEAMACSLPIVAADCKSGPREILAPATPLTKTAAGIEKAEYGILVPPGNGDYLEADKMLLPEEELLAETLTGLLSDEEERRYYSDAARERIKDFSYERISADWSNLINN